VVLAAPPRILAASPDVLTAHERATLRAAVARIVPAAAAGDWSAADVGADDYIVALLSGVGRIYAGGPVRSRFGRFQRLTRIKRIGWSREVRRLHDLYRAGLAQLDKLALGNFAAAAPPLQDAVLTALDDGGSSWC
jgi:DNA-binding GntR family transcriptional regulator